MENISLLQLRDKIDKILAEHPSWGDISRVGVVTAKHDNGFVDMDWLVDLRDIHCNNGLIAFQLVLEDDDIYLGKI